MLVLTYSQTTNEALHLAISADGLVWNALFDEAPLRPVAGARTMRDPFVIQANDGTFHLFYSDGWRSTSIVHSTSRDLQCWTPQELLPVMAGVPGAATACAPTCIFDPLAELYRIVWTSAVRPPGHGAQWEHRIWASATRDFRYYSPSKMFFDPGYAVSDSSVWSRDGECLMAYKAERGQPEDETPGSAFWVCPVRLNGLGATFGDPVSVETLSPVERPSLFWHGGRWTLLYDCFIRGGLGASVSADGFSWEIVTEEFQFPPGARHASALSVDQKVADTLRQRARLGQTAPL